MINGINFDTILMTHSVDIPNFTCILVLTANLVVITRVHADHAHGQHEDNTCDANTKQVLFSHDITIIYYGSEMSFIGLYKQIALLFLYSAQRDF